MRHVRRSICALALTLLACIGVLPSSVPLVASATPAAAVKAMGSEPFSDILGAADAKKKCGLSRDKLAALMLAPTYPEAGGTATISPSPMTLSRWDNQAALYAFGNMSTPYRKAFFHPGVGMWQFDSAGGWNLTAADAINTQTAANQAAATMAQRWCDSGGNRAYTWALWYGCNGGTCESIYNEIFDGTSLRMSNLNLQSHVTRMGGMVARQCVLNGVSVACHYVNPAAAQGNTSWASSSSSIPTPITAPFYVINQAGREHRVWINADTGYGVTIKADKPITGNARTTLVWSTGATLCDQTASRGTCGSQPRVATTPWGNRSENPFGTVDGAKPTGLGLTVFGWAIDPDTNNPINVHVYVDGTFRGSVSANIARAGLANAVPGYGTQHGYSTVIGGLNPGDHQVCAYALNVGPFGNTNPLLGCITGTVLREPFGSFDSVSGVSGGATVRGWAIDPDTNDPITVNAYVDGKFARALTANTARADVGAAYPGRGSNHGFDGVVPIALPGSHEVCIYGLNVGAGAANPLIGCRTVVVPVSDPFGSFDEISRSGGSVRVRGWAVDGDTSNPLTVHVYANGVFRGALTANTSRPDVGAAFPGAGPNRGFDGLVSVPAGASTVCIYALNVGPGTNNTTLGCRTA